MQIQNLVAALAGMAVVAEASLRSDNANFINFCQGQTLTNGEQKTGGSCNGIVMGKIPSQNQMVSTIIQNPPHNGNIQANQDFDVELKVNNLQAGSFTDAQSTYYSAPQNLNGQGQIIGHVHVTVQDMGGSLTPGNALDPSKFVFFKGINDDGDGNGNLKATVTGGLPAGNYRTLDNNQGQNQGQNGGNRGGKQNGGGRQGGRGGFPGQFPQFPGSATPGSATAQPQTGNANTPGQGGDGASNPGAPNQGGGASGNGNNGSGQNGNGNSGSGKGGATSNALGGVAAPAVSNSGDGSRPFAVNGNSFVSKATAVQRACDVQRNGCLNAFNSGRLNGGTVADCESQVQTCIQELS
ncbi:ribosomal protein S17 protein [Colletotrichum tofieldiae]|nr:ribosomal protein S17 protein [Colletotrichum tofieldiae]GKT71591.1 ribosomal protein S17 protein [Colletotrichum tofieldiae]GKT95248.1 ribosomal protein S17 protein [Colletotrichum tofieldiae]